MTSPGIVAALPSLLMPVRVDPTPNPNALKFTVDRSVGGPATYVSGQPVDNPAAAALLEIEGVISVFMTADFVTLSKVADSDWTDITPPAREILESHFG